MSEETLRVSDHFSVSYMRIAGGKDVEFRMYGQSPLPRLEHARRQLHHHSHYELVYVAEGELVQHFETGSFHYLKGDACFLNPNTRHCEGFESDCALFFVILPPDFLDQLLNAPSLLPGRPQYTGSEFARFLDENKALDAGSEYIDCACAMEGRDSAEPPLSRLLREIVGELSGTEVGYGFRVQGLLLRLFAELESPAHYHLTHIRVDSRPEEFIYARLLRYLEERHGRMTREELGQVLNYNGDYLNRIAKRVSGKTISHLGREIAVRDAKRMLSDTDESAASIVQKLGYSNRSHFYAMFESATGMTPGQWRTSHSSSEENTRQEE